MRALARLLIAATAMTGAVAASATSVFIASGSTPTLIGTVTANQLYNFSVTGVASLCSSCNNGGALNFTADGKPSGSLSSGYAPFAPNGLDHDPTGSGYGVAGPGFLIGALLLSATPTPGIGDFVASGLGGQFVSPISTSFYGLINDSAYGDNPLDTGYVFSFSLAGGVPEPATWALMLGGFGMVGVMTRRRSRQAVLA